MVVRHAMPLFFLPPFFFSGLTVLMADVAALGAFGQSRGTGKSVSELLGDPEAELTDLLDTDDFVGALAARNPEVLAFFKQGRNAEKLIELVRENYCFFVFVVVVVDIFW